MKWVFIFIFSLGWHGLIFAQEARGDFPLEMSVYPNPSTTGNFAIELNTEDRREDISIKVFNLIGKEVYRKKIPVVNGVIKETIQLHSVSKGIFILEVSYEDQKQTHRLSFI